MGRDWKGRSKALYPKINGEEKTVKPVNADVVNGFYSPLEKTITETKFDKLPAKQWIEKFARGEEAKWTGLNDWLSQQQGSVSKADIQKYLKENRVQIVEVVKGQEISDAQIKGEQEKFDKLNAEVNKLVNEYPHDTRPKSIQQRIDEIGNEMNAMHDKYAGQYDFIEKEKLHGNDQTKFSQYQLAGEKENYKEVLVTMPVAKSIQEYEVEHVLDGE